MSDETWTQAGFKRVIDQKEPIIPIGVSVDGFFYFWHVPGKKIVRVPLDALASLGVTISGTVNEHSTDLVADGTVIAPAPASLPVGVYDGARHRTLRGRSTGDVFAQLRSLAIEYDARDRNWSLTSADVPDLSDRAARLLGFVTANEMRAATLWVTATAMVNTGVTLTLPAAGAGLFHYIVKIELVKLYAVIGVANGAGVIITSTNLPGNPAWTTEQLALAAGSVVKVIDYEPTTPIKSAVANTATTFVAPLQLQTIWRWNVVYFTAA